MIKRTTKSTLYDGMINLAFKSTGQRGGNVHKFDWHHKDSRKLRRKQEREVEKELWKEKKKKEKKK